MRKLSKPVLAAIIAVALFASTAVANAATGGELLRPLAETLGITPLAATDSLTFDMEKHTDDGTYYQPANVIVSTTGDDAIHSVTINMPPSLVLDASKVTDITNYSGTADGEFTYSSATWTDYSKSAAVKNYIITGDTVKATNLQTFLSQLRFRFAPGKDSPVVEQITMSFEKEELMQWTDPTNGVRHFYKAQALCGTAATGTSCNTNKAYLSKALLNARTQTYNGLKGYAATITNDSEYMAINDLFRKYAATSNNFWLGSTSLLPLTGLSGNAATEGVSYDDAAANANRNLYQNAVKFTYNYPFTNDNCTRLICGTGPGNAILSHDTKWSSSQVNRYWYWMDPYQPGLIYSNPSQGTDDSNYRDTAHDFYQSTVTDGHTIDYLNATNNNAKLGTSMCFSVTFPSTDVSKPIWDKGGCADEDSGHNRYILIEFSEPNGLYSAADAGTYVKPNTVWTATLPNSDNYISFKINPNSNNFTLKDVEISNLDNPIKSFQITYPNTLTITNGTIGGAVVPTGWTLTESTPTGLKTALYSIADGTNRETLRTILAKLNFQGTPTSGNIVVSFAADTVMYWCDVGNVAQNCAGGNKHFYQMVPICNGNCQTTNSSWFGAYNLARAKRYYGLQGYLATITNEEEYQVANTNFIMKYVTEVQKHQIWLGGVHVVHKNGEKIKFGEPFTLSGNAFSSGEYKESSLTVGQTTYDKAYYWLDPETKYDGRLISAGYGSAQNINSNRIWPNDPPATTGNDYGYFSTFPWSGNIQPDADSGNLGVCLSGYLAELNKAPGWDDYGCVDTDSGRKEHYAVVEFSEGWGSQTNSSAADYNKYDPPKTEHSEPLPSSTTLSHKLDNENGPDLVSVSPLEYGGSAFVPLSYFTSTNYSTGAIFNENTTHLGQLNIPNYYVCGSASGGVSKPSTFPEVYYYCHKAITDEVTYKIERTSGLDVDAVYKLNTPVIKPTWGKVSSIVFTLTGDAATGITAINGLPANWTSTKNNAVITLKPAAAIADAAGGVDPAVAQAVLTAITFTGNTPNITGTIKAQLTAY